MIDCYFAHACGYCQGVRESLNRKMALTCRYCGGGFLFIVSLLCSIMWPNCCCYMGRCCVIYIFDMFHVQPSLNGVWIFEMYKNVNAKYTYIRL